MGKMLAQVVPKVLLVYITVYYRN